jgi:hypothetical protein
LAELEVIIKFCRKELFEQGERPAECNAPISISWAGLSIYDGTAYVILENMSLDAQEIEMAFLQQPSPCIILICDMEKSHTFFSP